MQSSMNQDGTLTDTALQSIGTSNNSESEESRFNPDEIAISVRNVSKKYRLYERPQYRLWEAFHPFRKKYHREFWALNNVSFNVKRGDTVGIIGRNGCGKSTLLQIIAGVLTPTSGEVVVRGRIAALLELGIGFNPELTGRENVFYYGTISGISHEEMERNIGDIIAFADIGDYIDQPLKTYSSGMVVRLAFSVSANIEPDILIVDEALAVGDAAFQFKCIKRLERLTQSGVTLLFVSHDVGMIRSFCNHVIYLQQGEEKASGSPESMTELYLQNMRDEQVRSLSGSRVIPKTSLRGSDAIAFGTEQGRIVKACFSDTRALQSIYHTGDVIRFEVDVEFLDSVSKPALHVLINDRKLLDVSGSSTTITKSSNVHGVYRASVTCSFTASLGEGSYFITVVLVDKPSYNLIIPIDKQVGLLSFQILQPKPFGFNGIVDLAMDFTEE